MTRLNSFEDWPPNQMGKKWSQKIAIHPSGFKMHHTILTLVCYHLLQMPKLLHCMNNIPIGLIPLLQIILPNVKSPLPSVVLVFERPRLLFFFSAWCSWLSPRVLEIQVPNACEIYHSNVTKVFFSFYSSSSIQYSPLTKQLS